MHSREHTKLESLRKCEVHQARHRVGSIAFHLFRDQDCSDALYEIDKIVRTYTQRSW
jgi:hypothetical protein